MKLQKETPGFGSDLADKERRFDGTNTNFEGETKIPDTKEIRGDEYPRNKSDDSVETQSNSETLEEISGSAGAKAGLSETLGSNTNALEIKSQDWINEQVTHKAGVEPGEAADVVSQLNSLLETTQK